MEGLVITSTPEGRFVYCPSMKPPQLSESQVVACLLPFQEGKPLSTIQEEGSTTQLCQSSSGSTSPS
jgi:hypothetical protein